MLLGQGGVQDGRVCNSECLVRRYSSESSDYDRMPDSSKKPDSGEIVVEIPVKFNLHLLESGPPQEAITTKEELMKSYRDMSIIRRTEITANMLFKSQMIRGFCHL